MSSEGEKPDRRPPAHHMTAIRQNRGDRWGWGEGSTPLGSGTRESRGWGVGCVAVCKCQNSQKMPKRVTVTGSDAVSLRRRVEAGRRVGSNQR